MNVQYNNNNNNNSIQSKNIPLETVAKLLFCKVDYITAHMTHARRS